jgi:hypothetical protein
MRQIGAAMRQMLVATAATQWGARNRLQWRQAA